MPRLRRSLSLDIGARIALALSALVTASVLSATSCQGLPDGATCSDIPTGGCPIDRGGTCDDPTCNAVYDCFNGEWVISQRCAVSDGGMGGGYTGTPDGGSGVPPLCSGDPMHMVDGGDAGDGGCTQVPLDLSCPAMECTPDLMFPDCPVEAAEGCAECACLSGCMDFYVCTSRAALGLPCQPNATPGWVDVAYCTDDGTLVSLSK